MAFTDSSALSDQIIAAYDRSAFFDLRANAVFDQFTTVKPGNLTNPGSSVKFLFYGDMTATTAALTETVDIDAVALSDSIITVTPVERGNAVLTTLKLETNSLALSFDANVANLVGYNMVDSMETVAREGYDASGVTSWVDGMSADSTIGSTNIVQMNDIRANIAALRTAKVQPYAGEVFAVVIHPDVEYDLMVETTEGSWSHFVARQPSGAGDWYAGEATRAAGAVFVSSPRAFLSDAGGSGNADLYTTYILGDQAIAKAESIPPHIIAGPVTDTLMRFRPLGWYSYLGYGQFRSTALRRLRSSSSLGTAT